MMPELVSNLNYHSSLVMRADVVWDDDGGGSGSGGGGGGAGPCKLGGYRCRIVGEGWKQRYHLRRLQVREYNLMRSLVRKIVQQNPAVDNRLFYREDRTAIKRVMGMMIQSNLYITI